MTALADYHNRYEIIKAAEEASIDQDDPMWVGLTDRQKWDVIADMNGQNFLRRVNREQPLKSQAEIISKILKK